MRRLVNHDGCYYLFYDPYQQLYSSEEEPPENYLIYGGGPYILKRNMRNTDQITKSLFNVLEIGLNEESLSKINGKPPEVIYCETYEDSVNALKNSIVDLCDIQFIDPTKITVVSLDASIVQLNNPSIHSTTVRKYKGLESDIVIVVNTDFSHIIDPVKKRLLYVAISRAKVHAIIIVRPNNTFKQLLLDKWKCTPKDLGANIGNFIINGEG